MVITFMKKIKIILVFLLLPGLVVKSQTSGALALDGSNDIVNFSNASVFNITSAIILEAWLYPTAHAPIKIAIAKFGDIPNNDSYTMQISNGRPDMHIRSGGSWHHIQSSTVLPLNQWSHVAGTFDGNEIKVYVNGVLTGTLAFSGPIDVSSAIFRIGGWAGGHNFSGRIDEVRVWNTARTQAEIQNTMNSQILSPPSSLVAYYKLNQGYPGGGNPGANTVTDASGNGNNGSLVGSSLDGCISNWVCGPATLGSCTEYCNPTWLGTTNNNWNTASNWSDNSVPVSSDDITILNVTNNPTISSHVSLEDLTINTGADVVVSSGSSLTLNGTLTNDGTVTLLDRGSFLQGGSSSLTGSGTFRIHRSGSTGTDFNFWSSPISSANTNLLSNTVFTYNPAQGTADPGDDNPADPGWIDASNSSMTVAKGYAAMGGANTVFVGTPNNGNQGISVSTHSSPHVSYNLIGNPYPSAISATSFLLANTGIIQPAIYLWDDDHTGGAGYASSDYATFAPGSGGVAGGGGNTPTSSIASCQGFKVLAATNGTVNFTNSLRTASGNGQLFSQGENVKAWLSATSSGNHYNQTLITFMEGASDDLDWGYDAEKIRGNSYLSLYTFIDEKAMAIQGFGPLVQNKVVPLGLASGENTTITLNLDSAHNLANAELILEDAQLNVFHNLSDGEYTFNALEMEYSTRFYLHFNAATTGLSEEKGLGSMYYNDGRVYIKTNVEGQLDFDVFNTMGQNVYSLTKMPNGLTSIDLPVLSSGTYIIRMVNDGQVLTDKIVIN